MSFFYLLSQSEGSFDLKEHSASRNGSWFSRKVAERTTQEIARQNAEFARIHQDDSDRQLLDYVRNCVQQLGFTPNAREIIGGEYIGNRMGGWKRVLEHLPDLPKPGPVPHREKCLIYRQEYQRQMEAFRAQRNLARKERDAHKAEKNHRQREEKKLRLEADLEWGEEHAHLTDRQLLEYIVRQARRLGYTPTRKEVEGARYIARHFGSWAVVLELASLPLPPDLKPPKESVVQQWRRRLNLQEQPLLIEDEDEYEG